MKISPLLLILTLLLTACNQPKTKPNLPSGKEVKAEVDQLLATGPATLIIIDTPKDQTPSTPLTRWAADAFVTKLKDKGYAHMIKKHLRPQAKPCQRIKTSTLQNKQAAITTFKPDVIITFTLHHVTLIENSTKKFEWTYKGNTIFEVPSKNVKASWLADGKSQLPPIDKISDTPREVQQFLAHRWANTKAHQGYGLINFVITNPKR